LITPVGKETEAVTRLARIAHDNVIGYLDGGFKTWKDAGLDVNKVDVVSAEDIRKMIDENTIGENTRILDVRNPFEWAEGVLPNAILISLRDLNDQAVSKLNTEN